MRECLIISSVAITSANDQWQIQGHFQHVPLQWNPIEVTPPMGNPKSEYLSGRNQLV